MKLSKTWITFVIIFLLITLIPAIYLELNYWEKQWMWALIIGGLPWSKFGFSVGFFASNFYLSVLSWLFLWLAYFLNGIIAYLLGYLLEKIFFKK